MHDNSSAQPVWHEFVPISLPAPATLDDGLPFDTQWPHYEVNYCELQASGTPCDTSAGLYYGTFEPFAPRLCPRHYRELVRRSQSAGRLMANGRNPSGVSGDMPSPAPAAKGG